MNANEHMDAYKKAKEAYPFFFSANKTCWLILNSVVQQRHQKQEYILYDSIFM